MSVSSGYINLDVNVVEKLLLGATRPADLNIPFQIPSRITYAEGTGANQINRIYYRKATAAASTPFVLDLSTAVCADGSVGIAYIRDGVVWDDATNAVYTLIYGGGTTPFTPFLGGTTPTVIIQPGGHFRIPPKPLGTNGWPVGTGVNFRLDPGSNPIDYRILLLGTN